MASQDVTPATKSRPSTADKNPEAKSPVVGGGVHRVATEHGSNPGHDLVDHSSVNPLPAVPRASRLRGTRHDRGFFAADDGALTKQILATHAPDIEELDVKPVLSIIEDILRLGKPLSTDPATGTHVEAHLDALDEKKVFHSPDHESEIINLLAFPINKIAYEITCKCAAGGEAHAMTMDLLKLLSSYSWDAKVVITFAAFAINYGEFWLVEHLHTRNPLAKNIATLKDVPEIMEHAKELKKHFEAVLDLLNSVLKVTYCLIEFKELPSAYISRESPEMVAGTTHIPTAVYWITRSLLACASILLNLIGSGHEYITSTAESWEVLSLAHKLSVILEHLQKQLATCRKLIEKRKEEDAYIAFKRLIESPHINNMKVLRAMIHARDDQRPLYDGSKRTNERLEVLRMKYVLLLISDLDVPQEELNILHMIYTQQSMRHEYEVLWLPIVDPTTPMSELQNTVFYDLRNNNMPWYSVDHPSLVEPVAIRYIKEVWKFVHMPMLVVLDPQGKPSNLDALPMMWIWGSEAFPFTETREGALWAEHGWNIRLLADNIDPRIPEWIADNRVICLYGGEDIDWIRKFTLSVRAIANNLQVPLEMLYVGKRSPKDKVSQCHVVIDREKLSHVFSVRDYYDYVWYFWVRLWSMWNSKKHIGMTVENDRVMQEIMDLLTFDSSEEGWAVFSRGNFEMTKGKGDVIVLVLDNFNNWGYKVDHPDKFVTVLDEEIRRSHPEHHCNRLILPGHAGYIPERVVCSECGKTMEKYVMYRCCTD
ncbi:hypothetical protein CDL12_18058 [Handroanthus impetiginosus]|uniref:Sieve element occlusion n=1 Tax=Handroanthus impetiginosus TaxID=429701 RepID=A0A2G9GVP2_9LAMI|nr:hypothetical protein CDL12_18058 [Handroanthus impetiginosus]